MRKLLYGALCLAILASLGCCITNYPIITDTRGDYNGIIRTAHAAYIIPSGGVATLWDDGSDELLSFVYQSQNGDQMIQCKNNFDFSSLVNFVGNTYCDWRYENCAILKAWNPAQDNLDDIFDYEGFTNNKAWPDCSGARSLSILVSYGSRIGECGDSMFWNDKQNLYAEFANLTTTTWRGGAAYLIPVNGSNTTINLNNSTMPVYGEYNLFLTEELNMVVPMTPNMRHQLRWAANWTAENGSLATVTLNYGSVVGEIDVRLVTAGLNEGLGRF
jgi:hypothetical protein